MDYDALIDGAMVELHNSLHNIACAIYLKASGGKMNSNAKEEIARVEKLIVQKLIASRETIQ